MHSNEFSAKTLIISTEPSGNVPNHDRPRGNQRAPFSQPHRGSSANAMISVGMIDEDPFICDCIITSLKGACHDVEVAPFNGCGEVLKLEKLPDVIVYRYAAPEEDDGELARFDQSLMSLMKEVPLIILGTKERVETIIEAFENGARGYVPMRTATVGLMIEIIRFVKAGGTFVPECSLPSRVVNSIGQKPPGNDFPCFTPRERAVLSRLKRGNANKVVAYELGISESTVKLHIRHIMKKLKVTNRTAIVSRLFSENCDEV